jgi:hypothetical protein
MTVMMMADYDWSIYYNYIHKVSLDLRKRGTNKSDLVCNIWD